MPKKMRVKLTGEALSDLDQIGDYIAVDNPRRGRSFVRELRSVCGALGEMADRYPFLEGREALGYAVDPIAIMSSTIS